ncbi:hypothetical protein EDD85DRAFT_796162 [Armillaria nabsnona]|nr:hypothetical protein EDD85DRAFT_796162 [Armillaria nabsnona]
MHQYMLWYQRRHVRHEIQHFPAPPSHFHIYTVCGLFAFSFFLVLTVGQPVDVGTAVRSKDIAPTSIGRIKDDLKPANLQDGLAPLPNRDVYSSLNVSPHFHPKISPPANTPVHPSSLAAVLLPRLDRSLRDAVRSGAFEEAASQPVLARNTKLYFCQYRRRTTEFSTDGATLRSEQLQAGGYFWLMIVNLQPGVWKALFIRLRLAMGVQNSSEKKIRSYSEFSLSTFH